MKSVEKLIMSFISVDSAAEHVIANALQQSKTKNTQTDFVCNTFAQLSMKFVVHIISVSCAWYS